MDELRSVDADGGDGVSIGGGGGGGGAGAGALKFRGVASGTEAGA
jgi:hypothetical protein